MSNKPRKVRIEGEDFLIGRVEDLPPKAPRKAPGARIVYPADRAYADLDEGGALFIKATRRSLQDEQSWWQRRLDAIARKTGLRCYSRRDNAQHGVWFTKERRRAKVLGILT